MRVTAAGHLFTKPIGARSGPSMAATVRGTERKEMRYTIAPDVKPPLVLRVLPSRFRIAAWGRFYRRDPARWSELYRDAELLYAPGVRMELVPGDVISDRIAFTGVHELTATRRIVHLAQGGGLFIDVGANLGYFALLWAAASPENRCVAVEPSPRNVALLHRNIRRNGFDSRIQVVPKAAGRASGTLRFDPGPADQTGWGGYAGAASSRGFDVPVVRVDDLVPVDGVVTLLKIDVEGAEAWTLMGCERLLRTRSVREVWFEQNKPRIRALGVEEHAAHEYLRSVGYQLRPLSDASAELVEWSAVPETGR